MLERRKVPAGIAIAVSGCMCHGGAAAQSAPAIDVYGSLRTQAEQVSPAHRDRQAGYAALRDAYSRLGTKIDYPLDAGTTLLGQIEIPVDSANLRLRDPYDQREPLRIASVGLRGKAGTLVYGQQWMPYYNAIAAPVDMFSSYYSGFATYTVFRVARTIAYRTPELQGFSFSAAYAGSAGNRRSTSRIDARRWQAAAAFTRGDTHFAAGIDDRGNAGYGKNRLYGLSASRRYGKLYLAAKFELFDTGNRRSGGFSTDGNRAINFLASYVVKNSTAKLMLARLENYGGNIVHVGIDHALSDKYKIFAEIYREAGIAALTARRGGLDEADAGTGGGRAVAIGLRYDF